jgi:hypothetical protein
VSFPIASAAVAGGTGRKSASVGSSVSFHMFPATLVSNVAQWGCENI